MLKLYYLFEKRKQKAVKLPVTQEKLPVSIGSSDIFEHLQRKKPGFCNNAKSWLKKC
jgi:hypothetical protein